MRLLLFKLQGDKTPVKHFTKVDNFIRDIIAVGTKVDRTDKVTFIVDSFENL